MQSTPAVRVPFDRMQQQYKARAHAWELAEIFSSLRTEDLHISADEKQAVEPIFWHSVCTEYDAHNFFEHLLAQPRSWSVDFLVFVYYWLRDEKKHTRGFAKLYSLLYGESIESIYKRLAVRPVDFSVIAQFFDDELRLCVLLAYDEIVTTHVYHRSMDFYDRINKPYLGLWIRYLKADEAMHFGNLIRVIQKNHAHRAHEVPGILEEVLTTDRNATFYGSTFVLDHNCDDFSLSHAELETLCGRVILQKILRGKNLQAKGSI